MNKRTFVKNTAVMTVTSLLLRTLGIVFRVFISNRVGAEGMGLYQLVFSVYVLGTTFAAAGLTTAVTRLVAEHLVRGDSRAVRRVMRSSVWMCIVIGVLSALLLYIGAPLIGDLIGDVRAIPALRVSGIALPFIGISSCIKGYFAARRRAGPPSVSQIIEQLTRIGGILWMLELAGEGCTLEDACRIIILGDALSETVACGYLTITYRLDKRCYTLPSTRPQQPVLRPLLTIALPLTAGRYLSTLLRTVENILVPARLTIYTHSNALSLSQFGAIKGMALPLIFFPSAFLMTVSGLLIPELSDAHALGHRRQVAYLVERAVQVTAMGGILIGCFFTVLGRQLGVYLYGDDTVGLYLQILGPLTPVMYLDSVASGMLKGLGQQVQSLWYSIADSAVRVVLILILLPLYGITGFLFVMLVSNLLTSLLNTHRLLTVSGSTMQWRRWVLSPLLIAVLGSGGWAALQRLWHLPRLAELLVGGGFIVAVYVTLLPLFRCVTREDLKAFTRRKTA